MKYYIASGLENAEQVKKLKKHLDGDGWTHTYDWTVHGSVQREGVDRIREVATAETDGVLAAEAVIVLLPGGRGTHVELGIALSSYAEVFIYSPTPDDDFGTGGKTCAFYHHPNVTLCSSWDELIENLNFSRDISEAG